MVKNLFNSFLSKDFFQNVNLHIHSTFSDGKVSFSELIKQAKSAGLKHFSITDHNTLEGYFNLNAMPDELITGVEFDCYFNLNLPHILGYGVDVKNERLLSLTKKFKKGGFELPLRILSSRNPEKVIEAIHSAGGIAVLAHPCCYWCLDLDKFVKKLKALGLDGIEAYYPYNRMTRILKFHSRETVLKLAKKYDLIITGGTDCHGELI